MRYIEFWYALTARKKGGAAWRAANLRDVPLLLEYSKIKCTVGYLGIEVDDAPCLSARPVQQCDEEAPIVSGRAAE